MTRIRTIGAAVLLAAGLTLGTAAVAEAAPPGCTLQGKAQMLCKDPSKQPKPRPETPPSVKDLLLCGAGIAAGPLGGALTCIVDLA